LRCFLGEEVAAGDLRPLDMRRKGLLPDVERRRHSTGQIELSCQSEHRAADFFAGGEIGLVGLAIERGASAIVLAESMDARGFVRGGVVVGERARSSDFALFQWASRPST